MAILRWWPSDFDRRIALVNLFVQIILAFFAGYTLRFFVMPVYETSVLRESAIKLEQDIKTLKADFESTSKSLQRRLYETERMIIFAGLSEDLSRCATKQYDGKDTSWKHLLEASIGACFDNKFTEHLLKFENSTPPLKLTEVDRNCVKARYALVAKDLDRMIAGSKAQLQGEALDSALRRYEREAIVGLMSLTFYVSTATEPDKCRG